MRRRTAWVLAAGGVMALWVAAADWGAEPSSPPTVEPAAPAVDFDRHIRPILSDNCFVCHGPDEGSRKAGLRLDIREGAMKDLGGYSALVPGSPDKSEIFIRITETDPDILMPPPASGKKLTAQQKDLIKSWIEQKSPYNAHWSFVPPKQPDPPPVKLENWARNDIDRFILARLESQGLKPSPEADRHTLIRRVTLDLTGLPPTPAEVDAFLADASPQAYEKLVDRLLASPRYGERMAIEWLDAARYADTHGFHIDSGRDMTRWREWVIDAFNANMPFDQFTVEQLAGDMLPNATLEQRIASGFNRNHMINFEGGAIPEEYHAAYVMDRVNATSTVWLGLTVACAQCHDHKYDPIPQKDYFRLYAFFNNVPENGLDGNKGNAAPMIRTPTAKQDQELRTLAARVADLEKRFDAADPAADEAQAAWERESAAHIVTWTTLDPSQITSRGGATLAKQQDQSILVTGANPEKDLLAITAPLPLPRTTGLRLEILPHDSLPSKGPGRSQNGNVVLTEITVLADDQPIKLASATADFSQETFPVAQAIDGHPSTGWAIFPQVGKPHTVYLAAEQPIEGRKSIEVRLAFESQFAQHVPGHLRFSATEAPSPHPNGNLPGNIAAALKANLRSDAQKADLRRHFRSTALPPYAAIHKDLEAARKAKSEADRRVRTTMVMAEMDKPRDTFILLRGQYDKRGEKVTPGVPSALPQLPANQPANRLSLARWLVDPTHPLTARVAVNRYWQMYFGTGLVKTADDFGAQGERPTHPELLDWLATRFIQGGWNVKAMQRLIVTSAAYRQASAIPAAVKSIDPENRLLARGARFRLHAEFIRDQALAASGLLNGEIGGYSVMPYQPPGLWEELMSRSDGDNWTAQKYVQSHGHDLYRRSMYTFWKRTSPPAQLATFDAPDREICTVRRARTNTPLQALVLLNDPTYVEASRKLAERLMREGGPSAEERIGLAYRLVLARPPRAQETAVLRDALAAHLAKYRADPQSALKLLATGESPRDEKLDPAELAAWTMIASTLFNLDETITKG